ncbi:DNA polymerase III subunit [Desulfobacula sp.]|uniref:DNA polymerase III subunit n=1 Tax=Desulfobacula sp. TaxID=2593537 RepID=UPI0026352FC7|nr:DNA polymerase III subunit [Desulfobacula sp.]
MGMDQTMSDFDHLQYQATVLLELNHILQTKKIPNAFLFSGSENTGRKQAAYLFAKGCNCLSGMDLACNHCTSCRKIDAKSHPDILCLTLQQGKKSISISQIREMGVTLSSRPNEARFRMVLILTADLMNRQAQNALLKMLEEPPERTFFILVAHKVSFLLPTIASRCRKIRFKPLTDTVIEQHLIQHFNVDNPLAHIASRTADADLKRAMMYVNQDTEQREVDWIKRRLWLLDTLASMIRTKPARGISNGLMLSQRLSRDPDLMPYTMAILTTFFRDLMIFKFDPKKIVNLDFFDTFADINQRVPSHNFLEWIKMLYETEKRVTANSTLRLTLDRFFLKIVTNKGTGVYG